jgi:hypothetical protein
VAVAHATRFLDAALQLLEELRADHVELVALGRDLTQPLTQLRIAVVGSGWLVRIDRVSLGRGSGSPIVATRDDGSAAVPSPWSASTCDCIP